MADKTFMRITNKDIYDRINDLEVNNREQHGELIKHQLHTNGKVRLNRWVSTTALSITIILIGFIVKGF